MIALTPIDTRYDRFLYRLLSLIPYRGKHLAERAAKDRRGWRTFGEQAQHTDMQAGLAVTAQMPTLKMDRPRSVCRECHTATPNDLCVNCYIKASTLELVEAFQASKTDAVVFEDGWRFPQVLTNA